MEELNKDLSIQNAIPDVRGAKFLLFAFKIIKSDEQDYEELLGFYRVDLTNDAESVLIVINEGILNNCFFELVPDKFEFTEQYKEFLDEEFCLNEG